MKQIELPEQHEGAGDQGRQHAVSDNGDELFARGPHNWRRAEEGNEGHVEHGFGEGVVVSQQAEVAGEAPQHQERDAIAGAGDAQDKRRHERTGRG